MREEKPTARGKVFRILGVLFLWGGAPALFFLLGYLVLGPWYAKFGWFRPAAGPPQVETSQGGVSTNQEPWYDVDALPDRLGPAGGYVRARPPRTRSVQGAEAGLRSPGEAPAEIGEGEVTVLPDVPEDVPVHEQPPSPGTDDVQSPDTID